MTIRDLARQAALTIPHVRRFYASAQGLRSDLDQARARCLELEERVSRLSSERDDLASELERARDELAAAAIAREQAEAAVRVASEKREDVELRLYTLTSDFQRAVAASEAVRARLRGAEQRLQALAQGDST